MEQFVTRAEYNEHNRRMDDEHGRLNERVYKVEQVLGENNKLLISVERLASSMEIMQKEQKEQGERILKIENRDGEKWRTVSMYAITAVLGIFIGFALKQIGIF